MIKIKIFISILAIFLLSALGFSNSIPVASAISGTNVQPGNLVQSNVTSVTVTFTSAVTLPADGKVKVVFPAGFNVSGATTGRCTSMNGGFSTSISAQTVTITRDNTGSARLAGAQSCTIDNIANPSLAGSTGTYAIGLYQNNDTLLEQDLAVSADTIIAPGALAATNVEPENLIELTRSRYAVSFTTANPVTADGQISVTFPAGFNVSAANGGTCASMNGGFSTSVNGQTVTLIRDGLGTVQTPAAETCVIDGIAAPAAGLSGTYTIRTKDRSGNSTDSDPAVSSDMYIAAPALVVTNVQPASLVAGATSTVTISFTTVVSTPISAKVRVTFPAGFDLSAAGTASCSSMPGTESSAIAGQVLTITRAATATEPAAAETCIIPTVKNPPVSGSTGTYSIEIIDDQASPAVVSSDTAVSADTITPGTLTATNVQPENLVVGITSEQTVTFNTTNPIPANGKISVDFPAGFNVSAANAGTCAVMDGTFSTSVAGQTVTISRNGSLAVSSTSAITCIIKDITAPAVPGAGGVYAIRTEDSLGNTIDSAAPTSDTFIASPSLGGTNVQPTSLVASITSDNAISFNTSQYIPAEGKIKITFGAGFNVSGAYGGECSGFDGTLITSVAGQTVILSRGGTSTTVVSGAKTCRLYGIKNQSITGSTGTYSIFITDKTDATVASNSSVAADTIINSGTLTAADVQPGSLVAGHVGTNLITFSAVGGIPTGGKIKITFPSGFDVSAAADSSCVGLTGTVSTSVSGQTVTLSRDASSAGQASGTVSCSIDNIKNPTVSGSTGTYLITTADPTDTTISTASPTADTITAGALSSADVQPDTTLISAANTVSVNFNGTNPLPGDGKIVIVFPAGYDLTGVGTADMSCTGLAGTLSASTAGNTLTAARSGGSATSGGDAFSCAIANIINPTTAGSAGTYTLRTTNSVDAIIDENSSVAADTFGAAGTLTNTNVEPESTIIKRTGTATISFTSALGLPRDGKIRITFPAGFLITGANGAGCGNMDGSFATSVSGQSVTITRSGGTGEPAGTSHCQIAGVRNPSIIGSGGTYSIELFTASDQPIESDLAVAADNFVPASSGGGGGGGGNAKNNGDQIVLEKILTERQERVSRLPAPVHSLVKLPSDNDPTTQYDTTVYYLGADGYRHAFPNDRVFFSWFCDFSSVITISAQQLASIPLAENITYRPGYKMIKFTSIPKVYAVDLNGQLRWLTTEALASTLYGDDWTKQVDDVSDAFFYNYYFGNDIASIDDFNPGAISQSFKYPSDNLNLPGYSSETLGHPFLCEPSKTAKKNPYIFQEDWRFLKNISTGSTADPDVKHLQDFLRAQGKDIYPEGLVTGYFGPATSAAVKKFQSANKIKQTGICDDLTKKIINDILDSQLGQ
ncbi:MAG: peptidoglycan-binding protein [Patescibacteria group bacterium]